MPTNQQAALPFGNGIRDEFSPMEVDLVALEAVAKEQDFIENHGGENVVMAVDMPKTRRSSPYRGKITNRAFKRIACDKDEIINANRIKQEPP
jgi:hypothetical protein